MPPPFFVTLAAQRQARLGRGDAQPLQADIGVPPGRPAGPSQGTARPSGRGEGQRGIGLRPQNLEKLLTLVIFEGTIFVQGRTYKG